MSTPRGIRNNNPGNIEYRALTRWRGQIGSDGRFVRFDTPEHGIRALAVLLHNYQKIYGLSSIRQLITRWAPPTDNNDTEAYIASVSRITGIGPNDLITLSEPDILDSLVEAVIRQENGVQPYTDHQIALGIVSALG